jgi:hypothetical protein
MITSVGALSTNFTCIDGAFEASQEERRRPARAANTRFVSYLVAVVYM